MKKWFLLLILPLVLLSGCIKLDIYQTIDISGNSFVTTVTNMTSFSDIQSTPGMENMSLEDMCESFYNVTSLTNPTCSISGFVVTTGGELSLANDSSFEIITNGETTYKYDMRRMLDLIFEGGDQPGFETLDEQSLQQMSVTAALFGAELNYNLDMPGPIISADVGIITGNSLTVSVFELLGRQNAFVESRGPGEGFNFDLTTIIMIAVVVVMVVIVIAVVFNRKKKPDEDDDAWGALEEKYSQRRYPEY